MPNDSHSQAILTTDAARRGTMEADQLMLGYAGGRGIEFADPVGPALLMRRKRSPGPTDDWGCAGGAHPRAGTLGDEGRGEGEGGAGAFRRDWRVGGEGVVAPAHAQGRLDHAHRIVRSRHLRRAARVKPARCHGLAPACQRLIVRDGRGGRRPYAVVDVREGLVRPYLERQAHAIDESPPIILVL